MKYFIYTLMGIAVVLVIYNITKINFDAPFKKGSIEAVITAIAGVCSILMLAILMVSKKIEKNVKKRH
ncbi:MAG: hypothetical protein HRT67_03390 [Flavobacteriaceae bacterium]|nr:hypothetical protein [Flavobacteriaceae bacterium]